MGYGGICGIETGLLVGDVLLGRLELGIRLIESRLGVCRPGCGGILGLSQLLDGTVTPFAEGIEIGVNLAIPIGLLGLHVGLRGIKLSLLFIESLLGVCKLGVCLVEFSLEGIELIAGGILGCLGIGYLLLEVGYLSLGLVDRLLGILGGLLCGMDSRLGIDPCLLGGLDLLECVFATRLGCLVGRSSLVGRLFGIGLLRDGGIICRLRLGELLVCRILCICRGLNVCLCRLGTGDRLVICGLGIDLCRLRGIQYALRRGQLLVRLVQLALGGIHDRLGILHGLLGDLLGLSLGLSLVVRRCGRLGECHGLHDRGQHEARSHGHGDCRLHNHFLTLGLVFAHIEVLLPIGGFASPATIRQTMCRRSGLAAAAIGTLQPDVLNSRTIAFTCVPVGYVAM